MSDKNASITEIKSSDYLIATGAGIAYHVDAPTPLLVANILGAAVCDRVVAGSGSLALPTGLYVYRLGNKSGKIYVK